MINPGVLCERSTTQTSSQDSVLEAAASSTRSSYQTSSTHRLTFQNLISEVHFLSILKYEFKSLVSKKLDKEYTWM